MTPPVHRLGWAPPLLVGASAAVAAEVAVGLLLYDGPGLVRSLTVILAVSGAALGGGLWTAPRPGPGAVDRLRRRWLLCMLAFMAAAVFGVAWTLVDALGAGRAGQGLGLAVLAALPLYASGNVLGGIATLAPTFSRGVGTAAAAAVGAGIGFAITGVLLPRTPLPASLIVTCLVMLSLGGMVFGSVLAAVPEVRVLARRDGRGAEVVVEERRAGISETGTRVLLEGRHERRRQAVDGEERVPWEVAVARALMPPPESGWNVLVVGGGASDIADSVVRGHPGATVEVLERTADVAELAREHFAPAEREAEEPAGDRTGDGRSSLRFGNFEDLTRAIAGARCAAVLVDAAALGPIGGWAGLSRDARARLLAAVADEGVLAWGPTDPDPELSGIIGAWSMILLERSAGGVTERVTLATRDPSLGLPHAVDGFAAVAEREGRT